MQVERNGTGADVYGAWRGAYQRVGDTMGHLAQFTASTWSTISGSSTAYNATVSGIPGQHSKRPHKMEEDKSWRCDLHPAWSRDFRRIAINGRPAGGDRQVLVLQLETDLSSYFK